MSNVSYAAAAARPQHTDCSQKRSEKPEDIVTELERKKKYILQMSITQRLVDKKGATLSVHKKNFLNTSMKMISPKIDDQIDDSAEKFPCKLCTHIRHWFKA